MFCENMEGIKSNLFFETLLQGIKFHSFIPVVVYFDQHLDAPNAGQNIFFQVFSHYCMIVMEKCQNWDRKSIYIIFSCEFLKLE